MPKYKHGKQTKPIEAKQFKRIMENGHFVQGDYHRSLLAFLYYFGVRISEALELVPKSFSLKKQEEMLVIDCPAKKGGEREPLEINYNLPYILLIMKQVANTRPENRVWRFTVRTAERIVKRAMGEKYYPHFFRLNRATHFLEDPTTTIPEMLAWFGWKASKTVDPYIGHSKRHIKAQAKRLEREMGVVA